MVARLGERFEEPEPRLAEPRRGARELGVEALFALTQLGDLPPLGVDRRRVEERRVLRDAPLGQEGKMPVISRSFLPVPPLSWMAGPWLALAIDSDVGSP